MSLGKTARQVLCLASLLLPAATAAWAERLPIKAYTTSDGLAQNTVVRIVRDSRGFLWLCTRDGLSRFDGYAFTNYGMAEGLPHPQVNHLLEARDGTHWIATNGGGVARLQESSGADARPLFKTYPVGDNSITNRVNILYEDRAGAIWAGTDGEVFRLQRSRGEESFQKVDLGLLPGHRWVVVLAFAEDREGVLWIGTSEGLFIRGADGRVRPCAIQPSQRYDWVRALLLDTRGRLWIGHLGAGAVVLDLERWRALDARPPGRDRYRLADLTPAIEHRFTSEEGLADDNVHSLYQSADGHVWLGTADGLSEFDGDRLHTYTKADGVASLPLTWLTEDIGGSLWAATPQGALKMARSGFSTFDQADGLSPAGVRSISQDRAGTLYVVTNDASIHAFDGRWFRRGRPPLPAEVVFGWPQNALPDRTGDWWAATSVGLFRFPRVGRTRDLAAGRPKAVFDAGHGLTGSFILTVYESAAGDMWIGIADAKDELVRWERSTGTLHAYTESDGLPEFFSPSCFAEDRSGALWVGLYDGGLLRYRGGASACSPPRTAFPPARSASSTSTARAGSGSPPAPAAWAGSTTRPPIPRAW